MLKSDRDRQIVNQLEEEHYKDIKTYTDQDYKYITQLANDCFSALMDNEIYLLPNENFEKIKVIGVEIAKNEFYKLLDVMIKDDDFRNAQFKLGSIEYTISEAKGFKVFYTKHDKDNISKNTVEVVQNLSEYISKVLDIKEEDNKTFYRGHGKWKYKLTPAIYREKNKEILQNESSYIKEMISSYPQYFEKCRTALDYLSILQHNGFPTRLLDFSENPLISLYMACDNNNDYASDVISISVPKEYFKYYDSDTVSILSNMAFLEDDFSGVKYKDEIKEFNEQITIKKLVYLIKNEKPFFEEQIDPKHMRSCILFVKSKQDFQRISRQNGLFALFGINTVKNKMPKIEYMDPPCNIKHFIIPKEFKRLILEELSRIGINEASVYCGLEHVASFYRKRSSNRKIEKHIERNETTNQILF